MRRIVYGYVVFEDSDRPYAALAPALDELIEAGLAGKRDLTLPLWIGGVCYQARVVLQERDSQTWPEDDPETARENAEYERARREDEVPDDDEPLPF